MGGGGGGGAHRPSVPCFSFKSERYRNMKKTVMVWEESKHTPRIEASFLLSEIPFVILFVSYQSIKQRFGHSAYCAWVSWVIILWAYSGKLANE